MSGTIQFDVCFGNSPESNQPRNGLPFKLLVIGDFSGRENRQLNEPLVGRKTISVDCDNLEQTMNRLGVELNLSFYDSEQTKILLEFHELDDFHPDQLYDRVEVFRELRRLRKRLSDPKTFDEAANEVRTWLTQTPSTVETQPQPSEELSTVNETETGLFDNLLKKPVTPHEATRISPAVHPKIAAFIKNLVSPYVIDERNPQQDTLIAAVDDAVSKQMCAILHHPEFQALEATWRGLDLLVRLLETGEQLTIDILDASKQELASEYTTDADLSDTGIYNILVNEARHMPGTAPWALWLGLFTFEAGDASLLRRIGELAAAAQAAFFAAYPYGLPLYPYDKKNMLDSDWEFMRTSQAGDYINLAIPRILLRLPYGEKTNEIDRFDFEEMPEQPVHENFLWGNPAIVCASLLGQSFSRYGWGFTPGVVSQLEGLPVHVYKADGESQMTPCAEHWLSDTEAANLSDLGLIPIRSIKGRDVVHVTAFHSISGVTTNVGCSNR